jgi:hypothetical protein
VASATLFFFMKTGKITLFFCLIILLTCTYKNNDFARNEYYQTIQLDGLFTISGQTPLNSKSIDQSESCWRFMYSRKGNLEFVEHLKFGELANDKKNGIASYKWNYDENNNVVEFCKLDVLGNMTNLNGIALERYKYDEYGNITEQKSFDAYNLIVGDTATYQMTSMKYHPDNSISEISFYGNLVETAHFDENGDLVVCGKPRFAKARFKYDESDNHIQTTYYDENERLMGDKFGVAIYKYEYDEKGGLTGTQKFSSSNKRIK